MRRPISLTLLTLVVVGVLVLPLFLAATYHADLCYDEWERCRERAMESDAGWIKTTLMLTVCDIALAKCLLKV